MKGLSAIFVSVLFLTTLLAGTLAADDDRTSPIFELPSETDRTTHENGFVENLGQWDDDILFSARTGFGHVGLGTDRIYYNIMERSDVPELNGARSREHQVMELEGSVITVEFEDSNRVDPIGSDAMPGISNFFIGSDPSKWASGARSYQTVEYHNIWDGIDIIFRLEEGGLKYDITVGPGIDTSSIVLRLDGHTELSTRGDDLQIDTPLNIPIIDTGLVAWYTDDRNEQVNVRFSIIDEYRYTFDLADRDKDRGVLIDPLVYSSYLGGSSDEGIFDSDLDSSGNAYLVGITDSTGFPTTSGAYQTTNYGNFDIFVSKTSSDGSTLIFSTFVGGTDMEMGNGIRVDGSGNVFVTGFAYSDDFPTTSGAYNETHWNTTMWMDVVVFKLSSTGTSLMYSTYVAGESDEEGRDIDIDSQGNAYVVGYSYSLEFPTTSDAYDSTGDDWSGDIILFKLSSSGSSLDYSSYIGGDSDDEGYGIQYDGSGNVYVTGSSWSSDFPTTSGAYQQKLIDWSDVIVFKFNVDRSTFIYGTYVGGDDEEEGYSISIDSSGYAYVTGYTWGGWSTIFPTTSGAYSTTYNGGTTDSFAFKLNQAGSGLVYSTFLGGSGDDYGQKIEVDANGKAYVCGYTDSSNYPTTPGADYTSFRGGSLDGTVSVVSQSGATLTYSSFLGGGSDDMALSLNIDANAEALVTGYSDSTNFPTTAGVISRTNSGGYDCFFTRLNFTLPPSAPRSLAATPGDDHIDLTWSAPTSDGGFPIVKYSIYKRIDGQTDTETINVTTLSYQDFDVEIGVKYMYSLSAWNMFKEGAKTTEVGAMVTSVPSPPVDLTALASVGKVDLDWNMPEFNGGTFITGYYVYKGTASGALDLLVELAATSTAYPDLDVEAGTTYYYQVTAKNEKGESEPSEEITATLPDTPLTPVNFSARPGNEFVDLTWEAPEWDGGSPIKSYKIFKGLDIDEMLLLKTVSTAARGLNDTKVTNGITYYYSITAVNDVGDSERSINISAIPGTVPRSPTLYEVGVDDGSLLLTWEPHTNDGGSALTSFNIYVGDSEDELELLGSVDAVERSYTHEELVNGHEYFYYLTAANSWGESLPSNLISGIPLGLPDAPASFEIASGDGFVLLSWSPPADTGGAEITTYHIFRAAGSGDSALYKMFDETTYNDTDVTNGETYRYMISAVNIVGESPKTVELSAQPLGLPGVPVSFLHQVGDGYIDLTWGPPTRTGGTPLMSYKLYKSNDNVEFEVLAEVGTETTGYHDTAVTNGVIYYYKLTAKNLQGESAYTDTIEAKPFGKPSDPMNVQVVEQDGTIVITWELPESDGGSDITAIKIYRSRDEGVQQMIATLDGTATTYTDKNVIEGSKYTYVVKAENAAGESASTMTYSIEIKSPSESGNIGLVLGIIAAVIILLLIVVLLIYFLVVKKKKGEEVPLPPPQVQGYPAPGQRLPGMQPQYGQLPQQMGYQQIPGYAPGQQSVLPPAYPPQQPPAQQQDAVYQGYVGYQEPPAEAPLTEGYQETGAEYYQAPAPYPEEPVPAPSEYPPAEPMQPVQEEPVPEEVPGELPQEEELPQPPSPPVVEEKQELPAPGEEKHPEEQQN
ncbi:MAG: fibronectin type III domain-containing protein [Thermoplasmatota archaeon]